MGQESRPNIDAVSGEAAWALVQILAIRLVKEKIISKRALMEDLTMAVRGHQQDKRLNPAQRMAALLLAECQTRLHGADRSGMH